MSREWWRGAMSNKCGRVGNVRQKAGSAVGRGRGLCKRSRLCVGSSAVYHLRGDA